MAKIIQYTCDRCGKEIKVAPNGIPYGFALRTSGHLNETKDLCDDCYVKLCKWFDRIDEYKKEREESDKE